MKTKALIGIAVASTFGWATSTYAGSSHDVITPLSVSEAGEVLPSTWNAGFGSTELLGPTAPTVSGMSDSSVPFSESTASASRIDESSIALANEGIYSDFYVVSAPVVIESWDYYVIDTATPSTEQVAMPVDVYLIPAYDVVVF